MADPSIADFLANGLPGGGARQNRYRVIFTFPAGVPGIPGQGARKLSYTVKATTPPGHTVSPAEVPYMGRVAKVAGDETIDDWTCSVLVDNDYVTRDTFEAWKQYVVNTTSNIGQNEPLSYMGEATVEHLDRKNNVIKRQVIKKIWPTVVGPMNFAYDANNAISEFDVTFAVNDLDMH